MALEHAAAHGWRTKRHGHHNTTDFSLRDAPAINRLLAPIVDSRVLPTLSRLYFPKNDKPGQDGLSSEMLLTCEDLFLVQYDATQPGGQRSLGAHRDESLLSFNIALNDPSEFVGGGTRFVESGNVLRPEHAGGKSSE